MILVLYCKCRTYVWSYHPFFFNELEKKNAEGLQIIDVSKSDLGKIKRKIDEADFVVLDQSVYMASKYSKVKDVFFYIEIPFFRSNDHYRCVWDYVLNTDKRILYSATITDIHALNSTDWEFGENFKVFFDRIDGVAWGYPYQMIGKDEVPKQYRDTWMDKHGDPLDHWNTVMSKKKINIGLHHCLHPKEIVKKEKRKLWQFSITGISYATRKIAKVSAEQNGIVMAPYAKLRKILEKPSGGFYKLKLIRTGVKMNMMLMKPLQDFVFSHSTISYTCGSGYKYFVRKFLEIPSQKSLLMCYPCIGLPHYGFKHEYSCIEVEPEDVGIETKFLLARPQLVSSIVKNATDVLLQLHTIDKRVAQFINAIVRMEKGRLTEAKFIDGTYVLID